MRQATKRWLATDLAVLQEACCVVDQFLVEAAHDVITRFHQLHRHLPRKFIFTMSMYKGIRKTAVTGQNLDGKKQHGSSKVDSKPGLRGMVRERKGECQARD